MKELTIEHVNIYDVKSPPPPRENLYLRSLKLGSGFWEYENLSYYTEDFESELENKRAATQIYETLESFIQRDIKLCTLMNKALKKLCNFLQVLATLEQLIHVYIRWAKLQGWYDRKRDQQRRQGDELSFRKW